MNDDQPTPEQQQTPPEQPQVQADAAVPDVHPEAEPLTEAQPQAEGESPAQAEPQAEDPVPVNVPDTAETQTEPTAGPAEDAVQPEQARQPSPIVPEEAPVGEIPAAQTTPVPDPAQKQRENDERRLRAQATWQRLVDAKTSGELVQALVKTPVKGGLLVDIEGYRGFLPASQSGVAKGTPLESLVGKTVGLKVLDVDETRKRLVVSHRRAQQEERRTARNELLKSLKVGEEREVTVVRLADFGAFVDLGSGIDALIPASELAFERVEKPADVVKIGEQLKVRVLRIDQGGKKIAVSRKGALADPWRDHASALQRGKTIEGKVVGKERGLEVEIAPGISGTVSDREANPDEYEIGESVEVTVRNVDYRSRRLRLSLAHVAATFTSSSTSFAPLGAELRIPTNDQP